MSRLVPLTTLGDTPIERPEQDQFGTASFSTALAHFIDSESTYTPITLAISGPWGSGKTSIARMIETQLNEWSERRAGDRPVVTCWFDAWMHSDAPHLGAALAASVARVVGNRRNPWRRVLEPLPSPMLTPRERWKRRVRLFLCVPVIAFAALSIPGVSPILQNGIDHTLVAGGSFLASVVLLGEAMRVLGPALDHAARFVDDPGSEAARGTVDEVRQQLGRLIRHGARGGRTVVFVDNLERCSPSRALEVCEVSNQLLAHKDVVTILIADMEIIEDFASGLYGDLGRSERTGRDYLEKIIQAELSVPLAITRPLPSLSDHAPHGPEDYSSMLVLRGTRKSRLRLMVSLPIILGSGYASWQLTFGADRIASELSPALLCLVCASLFIIMALLGTWGASTFVYERRRRRSRMLRRGISAEVRERRDGVAQSDLQAMITAVASPTEVDLARTLVEKFLFTQSPELVGVEELLLMHPRAGPRRVKRSLILAQLLTQIAREREIFGGNPAVTPAHLGKWIALKERWPMLAREIERDPGFLGIVEAQAAQLAPREVSAFSLRVRDRDIPFDGCTELVAVLTSEPRLGAVVDRIVRFEPAARNRGEAGGAP